MIDRRPLAPLTAMSGVLIASALLLACGEVDVDDSVQAVLRQDSAGVIIIDNGTAVAVPAWRVAELPEFTLGTANSAVDAFYRIRGGLLLGDSVIVVGDGGSNEIRYFDRSGAVLAVAGGRGGGPSEFRWLSSLYHAANRGVIAIDPPAQRANLYDSIGGYVHSWRLASSAVEGAKDFSSVVGALSNGDLVARTGGAVSPSEEPYTDQPMQWLARLTSDLMSVDTVGEFLGPMHYRGPGLAVTRVSFTAKTEFAVGPDFIVTGYGDDPDIRIFDVNGRLQQIVRWSMPRREVLPAHVEAELKRIAEQMGQLLGAPAWFQARSDEAVTHLTEHMPFPSHFPLFDRIVIDAGGFIWLEQYRRPEELADPWIVFAPDGELVGLVRMPEGVEVLDIGTGYVLGLHGDDDEVELVSLFAISR